MEYKNTERLIKIKELRSFSKAADELFVSRSALHQQIKQLETELGFSIYERNSFGTVTTEEGEYYLSVLEKLNRQYENAVRYCRDHQKNKQKEILTIGLLPNLSSPFLTTLCREYQRRYPQTDIQFREYFLRDYASNLENRSFDISVEYYYNYIHNIEGLKSVCLGQVSQLLEVVPSHPLADMAIVDFADLRGYKLMMYRQGTTRSEDRLREYILSHEPEIELVDIDNYDSSLFTRCELSEGVLLSYSHYTHEFSRFIHIPVNWDIPVVLGLCYLDDGKPAVRNFVHMAEELFPELLRRSEEQKTVMGA